MQWTDKEGRVWIATCTVGTAMQLKAAGIDLLNPEQLATVYGDPIEFLKLGAKLHSQQMQEHGISELDMLELMTSSADVAAASTGAIEAALGDFFHRMRGGRAVAAVLGRAIEAAAKTEEAQLSALQGNQGDRAVAGIVKKALAPMNDALERLGSAKGPGAASGQ